MIDKNKHLQISTPKFFMENFGRHFKVTDGIDWKDISPVFQRTHEIIKEKDIGDEKELSIKKVSRLSTGWVIIRPGSSTININAGNSKLKLPGFIYHDSTSPAFLEELESWEDGEPRIFITLSKKPIRPDDIFITIDKRRVNVCRRAGLVVENWLVNPPKDKWKESK